MGGFNPLVNRSAGGFNAGGGGNMVGLGQLLQMMQSAFGNKFSGQSAAGTAPQQGQLSMAYNPLFARSQRGGRSLMPSVEGAPQIDNLTAPTGGTDVAPAVQTGTAPGEGGGVPMGNLLQMNQARLNRMNQVSQQQTPYGGGLAQRFGQKSWQPFGPKGPMSFAMSAK